MPGVPSESARLKPVIALVGRPNVGKSTLFNRLTGTRDAIVADFAGLTRDRHYGIGRGGDRDYLVVDTAGFDPVAKDGIMHEMARQAEQAIAASDRDSLAKQVGVLTEALKSTAIDVTKILSSEVSDTAWDAYLKGDRGIFTRRAVRLIDAGTVRDIAALYSSDETFKANVSRYIHDFESMLRTVLSTRDGGVMGVTLLSSETGKLYVALAQAIERLRR